METLNNQENQSQPPINTTPAPVVPDETLKKRNYLPWLLATLFLAITLVSSFLILTGNQKKMEKNPVEINQPKAISKTSVAIDNPELIEFVRSYLKMGAETQFKIEKIEKNYAYGTGGRKDGGGFYWAAAKKDGQWNYVFGGNGIPECSEVEIFPLGTFKLAIGGGKFDECYNDKNELIDRKTGLPIK